MKATAVKERPILFSAPMIRAILRAENPKTQTRRILLPSDIPTGVRTLRWENQTAEELSHVARCKYGQPGDRLWVREKHVLLDRDGWIDPAKPRDAMISGRRNGVGYADWEHDPDSERCRKELGYKWRPSIHMPRWASRILLEITEVRVQRLQDITREDAIAEGIDPDATGNHEVANRTSVENFSVLWDSINAKRVPWTSNPWVWALTFKRLEQP